MSDRSARAEVLRRITQALADRPDPVAITRDYHGAGESVVPDPVGLFVQRLTDYRATAHQSPAAAAATAIATILQGRGLTRIAVPDGLPTEWITGVGFTPIPDDPPLSPADLDTLDGVLTSCACAIALTGTIVLGSGPGQGRRILTLLPDYHLIVVRAAQVVIGVPDAIAALDPTRPQTWISGPSATSDIELDRVEGVHGPRTLDVLILTDA